MTRCSLRSMLVWGALFCSCNGGMETLPALLRPQTVMIARHPAAVLSGVPRGVTYRHDRHGSYKLGQH